MLHADVAKPWFLVQIDVLKAIKYPCNLLFHYLILYACMHAYDTCIVAIYLH